MNERTIHAPPAPEAEAFAGDLTNLADARLGTEVVAVSDEFFAEAKRMLAIGPPVFVENLHDENGKWMDGWETRRRRGDGHDWAIVRLPRRARPRRVDLDTSFFTGNFAPAASLEGCVSDAEVPEPDTQWAPLLDETPLGPDRHHLRELAPNALACTHVRLNIFPDGGVARLRLYGTFEVEWSGVAGETDLVAALNGGIALAYSDAHYGKPTNILMPGRGADMSDGWETRRRREPGFDWAVLRLGHAGRVRRVEIDTAHFKGNFPHQCSIQAALLRDAAPASIVGRTMYWPVLLPPTEMEADKVHTFGDLGDVGVVSHLRVNLHPDGGISRLRAFGTREMP